MFIHPSHQKGGSQIALLTDIIVKVAIKTVKTMLSYEVRILTGKADIGATNESSTRFSVAIYMAYTVNFHFENYHYSHGGTAL